MDEKELQDKKLKDVSGSDADPLTGCVSTKELHDEELKDISGSGAGPQIGWVSTKPWEKDTIVWEEDGMVRWPRGCKYWKW